MNKGFKRSTIGIIVGTPSLFPLGLVIERHFEKTETWENVMFLGGCGGWGVGEGGVGDFKKWKDDLRWGRGITVITIIYVSSYRKNIVGI